MSEKTINKVPNVPTLRFKNYVYSWELKRLNNIAKIVSGGTPETEKNEYWNGDILWFTPSEVGHTKFVDNSERKITQLGLEKSNAKLLPIGTILLSTRATVGEVSISTKECTTNQGFQSVIVNKTNNLNFIYYLLQTLKRHFIKYACGSTFLEISNKEVAKTKIYIPSYIEQTKIGGFLSLIDERIDTQSKIIKEYKAYKKKILHTIYNRFNECGYLTLDQLCTITTGKLDANAMNPDGKYKFFTCAREDYYIDTYSFDGESLIISGNGEVGLIKYYNGKFDAYQRTYVLQSFKENPMFIKFALEIELPKKLHREKNVGAMPYIVLSTLTDIKIKIPDSATISKIATFVTLLDKKIATEEQILNDYLSKKKYLLSNMFI